jgi:putative PIN family toxin of toxin-antitoxin system
VKVVVDTNVLISSIFFSGPPHSILEAWRKADVQFVMSPDIIEEYYRVSAELSDQFHRVEISSILTLLITHSEVVQSHALDRQVCQDPDDDKFLACALSSDAKIIISGDKHLLKLKEFRGITILSPRTFLERFLKK